jgi:uncharacterized protein
MRNTTVRGEKHVLVFIRYPEEGKVKTRLAQRVGNKAACELYSAFVQDVLARLRGYSLTIYYTPSTAASSLTEWLGNDYAYEPQRGDDLGIRMYNAFQKTLSRYEQVVLIGSDCPDLSPSIIEEAFHNLADHDMVLGPASDGGYYLLGLTSGHLVKSLFQGLTWGGKTVFNDTMTLSRQAGLRVHILPPWTDIDDIDALRHFFQIHRDKGWDFLATLTYLHAHPEMVL